MWKRSSVLLLSVLTLSTSGAVSMKEKTHRIEFIKDLSSKNNIQNSEILQRQLVYESLGLSLADRASYETSLIAEKIKSGLASTFEAALERTGSRESGLLEIQESLENEFKYADPSVQEELINFSYNALEEISSGGILNSAVSLKNVEKSLVNNLKMDSAFLNNEFTFTQKSESGAAYINSSGGYTSRAGLVGALVSPDTNEPWIMHAKQDVTSGLQKRSEHQIKLKVNLDFKGILLDIGPSISFSREYATQVFIMAEGLYPVFDSNGNFDFVKRDNRGNPIRVNGQVQKRKMVFSCEAKLSFETTDAFGADVSFVVPGYNYTTERKFSNKVDYHSRRVSVPEFMEGRAVTINYLSSICHNDFMRARVSGNMTVSDSLNATMRNMVAGLRIRNARTKCAIDSHCTSWYNNLGLVRVNNVARCVVDAKTKEFATCELRGLRGQACAVIENGRRVSDNMFERICDRGLRCLKVSSGGWLQEGITGRLWSAPKGECR